MRVEPVQAQLLELALHVVEQHVVRRRRQQLVHLKAQAQARDEEEEKTIQWCALGAKASACVISEQRWKSCVHDLGLYSVGLRATWTR